MENLIENRYEFIYFFDVENGNPNGDPDADNMPRTDPETNHGIVTDVCLKRKIRNYVEMVKDNQSPHRIYVREKAVLNRIHEEAHTALNIQEQDPEQKRKGKGIEVEKAREWMCSNFYDVRTFGAVMSTGVNCGQVRGPIQLNFAKSVDPIVSMDISITRMAVTTEKEEEAQDGDNRTMGRKHIIPYALYRAEGYVSPYLAAKTGFSKDDLDLFWGALTNMFEHDHSAARGKMCMRNLIVFQHDSRLGNAPSDDLFKLVDVGRSSHTELPARSISDYNIVINYNSVPDGVSLTVTY